MLVTVAGHRHEPLEFAFGQEWQQVIEPFLRLGRRQVEAHLRRGRVVEQLEHQSRLAAEERVQFGEADAVPAFRCLVLHGCTDCGSGLEVAFGFFAMSASS